MLLVSVIGFSFFFAGIGVESDRDCIYVESLSLNLLV